MDQYEMILTRLLGETEYIQYKVTFRLFSVADLAEAIRDDSYLCYVALY